MRAYLWGNNRLTPAAEVKRRLCTSNQKTGATEQDDLEVTFYRLAFDSCLVRILAGTQAVLTEVFRGFPQSLQVNLG